MERQLMCQPFKVMFECPKCKVGEMNCLENQNRLVYSFGKPPPTPRQMAHRCTNCGFVLGLNYTYPYVSMVPIEMEGFQTEGSA